jgi:importin subunit alpha-1
LLKKTIDAEVNRAKRAEQTVQLRKDKREESINNRRKTEITTLANTAASATQDILNKPDLSQQERAAEMQQRLKVLPELVRMLHSDEQAKQVEATTQFRKLLSIERQPPIQEVIDCNVVPRLVQFLTFNANPVLQFEAAWALTNIASGTTKHTRVVIDAGAVNIFVQLLQSHNDDVKEQAVWALGNIAGDSAHCRDLVLQAGALEPLLSLCTPNAKITMLRNATWSLSNLCRGKPQPPFEQVQRALPVLAQLIWSKDDEVLTDACWALSYLSDDTGPHNQKIQAVISSGVCRRLVELLMHRSPNVKTPALRTVGNIVTGDDLQTQVIMNCSVLPCLLALLVNPKKGIRKEACWTISNITAGSPDQIQAVIDAQIIPPLVNILKSEEFDIQKEAAWAISNATSGGRDEQIRYLVRQQVIPPLCELFTCPDPKIIMVAMEGIENILKVGKADAPTTQDRNVFAEVVEECRGLDNLEALQQHENEEIYDKAMKILRNYFDVAEANQAPAAAGGNNFNFGGGDNSGGFSFGS